jgi:predicted MFS family arabinose efflux permease
MLGSLVGGAAAAAFGWRAALWIVAAPGVLLAALVLCSVQEPQRGAGDDDALRHGIACPALAGILTGLIFLSAARRSLPPP